MVNLILAYHSITNLLDKLDVKNSSHLFPSGTIILDIWYKDNFYVLQFEGDFVGFSEVTDENLGFDMVPDEKFLDGEKVVERIELLVADE